VNDIFHILSHEIIHTYLVSTSERVTETKYVEALQKLSLIYFLVGKIIIIKYAER